MKTVLLLTVLLSGILTASAAAVEAVEPAEAPVEVQLEKPVVAVEPAVAPVEVQEENPVAENEVEAMAPKGRFFSCPAGWIRYKNGCYLYVSSGRTWSSALAYCSSLGASLASVSNVFDYSFLQELTQRSGQTVAWLGGFYFQGWRWVDQTPFSYGNWYTVNSATSYPCIYLNSRVGWSNHNCNNGWPFICVKQTC